MQTQGTSQPDLMHLSGIKSSTVGFLGILMNYFEIKRDLTTMMAMKVWTEIVKIFFLR